MAPFAPFATAGGLAALAALAALTAAPRAIARAETRYQFGAGPHNTHLEAAAATHPSALQVAPFPERAAPAWRPASWSAADWERYGDALLAAADAGSADADFTRHDSVGKTAAAPLERPPARAELALAALASDRHADAWAHAAMLAPADLAALLPAFLPGAPGGARELPSGVVLRPALPPPSGARTHPDRGRAQVQGFTVGGATVDLAITVEGDGVELEFVHRAGPAVEFSAVIPCPPRLAMTVEYVAWELAPGIGEPRAIQLVPGAEPVRLWGRFERAPPRWPGRQPDPLPAQVEHWGFEIVLCDGASHGDSSGLAALAPLITRTSGAHARATTTQLGAPANDGAPVRIDLCNDAGLHTKVSALLTLLERHTLGAR